MPSESLLVIYKSRPICPIVYALPGKADEDSLKKAGEILAMMYTPE